MATCSACGGTILFGGRTVDGLRFCNLMCVEKGKLALAAARVPDGEITLTAAQIHGSTCPKCGGSGPVDVHISHQVWSAIYLTRWKSIPVLCCRKCGVKSQVGDLVFSMLAGWWGIPWGIFVTPMQVFRNIGELASPPSPARPSERLLNHARRLIASTAVEP